MAFLYNFGLSQEDERTEAKALALDGRDHVLSIASGGDMPLSLLALGAGHVHAIDIDPHQIELMRLKLAAVCALERGDAIRFLGFMPASARRRRGWFQNVLAELPEGSARFWKRHQDVVLKGAIWAGRFERYVRAFLPVLHTLVGRRRVEALCDCSTLEAQRESFRRAFDRKRVRFLFKLAFHPRVFRKRGMDPRSLQHRTGGAGSLADQYFDQFRTLCTATPSRDNHLLHLFLLGRVLSGDVVPAYLSRNGARVLRQRRDHLEIQETGLMEYLNDSASGRFNKAHLSNVPDWLDQAAFDQVMRQVCERAEPAARVVWRFIHVDRTLPPDLVHKLVVDRELGDALGRDDRFPFYGIVPARLDLTA